MWRIGLLYRVVDLLQLLSHGRPVMDAAIAQDWHHRAVGASQLWQLGFRAGWITRYGDGQLRITERGTRLLTVDSPELRLREQVKTLIELDRPSWASAAVHGRAAVARYAPSDALQCLQEAGLLTSTDNDVISWWDHIAAGSRMDVGAEKVATGRAGERLTVFHERNRTGQLPKWVAIDLEGAGYDVLSQVDATDDAPLVIEVKASVLPWSEAWFHITAHEWAVLLGAAHGELHLWSLATATPVMAVVSPLAAAGHVPMNNGDGEWEVVRCPYCVIQPLCW
jgi:hypothetical protein